MRMQTWSDACTLRVVIDSIIQRKGLKTHWFKFGWDVDCLCQCVKMQWIDVDHYNEHIQKTSHLPAPHCIQHPIWILAVPMCRFVVYSIHVNLMLIASWNSSLRLDVFHMILSWEHTIGSLIYSDERTSLFIHNMIEWKQTTTRIWFGSHYRLPSSYHHPCLAWNGHGWRE